MRQLHIGGTVKVDGWEVFDALPGPVVDHLGNAKDLSRFPDGTFTTVYASHVLEHFDYKDELAVVLREWWRVLVPGGRLFISVPDLDVLCRIFCERKALTPENRFLVMRMIFGGHTTPYDYHLVGLNHEFLASFMRSAGFTSVERVPEFTIFEDTSRLRLGGVLISLNVIAHR